MMPLAPTSISMALPPSSKPKIGFSIDSIVGNRKTKSPAFSPNSEGSERPSSPLSDCSYPNQQRSPKLPTSPAELHRALRLNEYAQLELHQRLKRSSPVLPSTRLSEESVIKHSINNNRESPPAHQTRLSPDPNTKDSRTPSPTHQIQHTNAKGPILVPGMTPPGLVRPFPVVPPSLSELKSTMAPYPPPEMMQTHNPFIAAQFQAAAALAHAQASQFPPGAIPQHPAHLHNPNMPRESYPLYPWLLNRHGRIFPHRFPGNFLLQPFRKPKRVRTAFSPSQLLKLEHAFENNHYVVGAERKTLAQQLSLSETQVKVWFQNRRTKHKRMQQDEDGKSGENNDSGNQSSSPHNYEDDDELDVEMDDDCPSDEEDVA